MDTQSSKFARKPQLLAPCYPRKGGAQLIPVSGSDDLFAPVPHGTVKKAKPKDKCASDIRLDQYYTHEPIAAHCYAAFCKHFNPNNFCMVEPSAGTGSFFKLLPSGSLAYDVEPKYPGIKLADFLKVSLQRHLQIAVIGNPPFGKNSSVAVRFFNHAAGQSQIIAMILPRTFRKASIQNRLDRDFHLLWEETMPDNAFIFRSRPYNVPATFQIWERRSVKRALRPLDTTHPDFEFTTASAADFAIQRVGANAGRVHLNFKLSAESHYFIRGSVNNVNQIMKKLDFTSVTGNTAGNPSLAKSEIIALYRDYISRSGTATVMNAGNLKSITM